MRLAVVVALLFAFAFSQSQPQPPDAIFVHGNIYAGATWAAQDGQSVRLIANVLPRAQAMAVRGDRVIAIGSDAAIRKLKGKHTQVIDLAGHFVMPGFNDAHVHLASGGFEKLNVNLVGCRSLEEMKSRIAERAKTAAEGERLQGEGWDHTLWPGQELPSRPYHDPITGDHPSLFGRVDGHISVANSAALRAAGITRATPDPAGGKIDRDASGEPTGIVRETAVALVSSKIPKPSPSRRRQAITLALQNAASSGITSLQDNSEWENFLVYEDLESAGQLTARISEWLAFNDSLSVLQQHRAHHPQSDVMLHTGMLKGFMDGSLGSRTAALLQPYSDDPHNTGIPQYTQARLNSMIGERAAAGFQVGFHAIGDAGVEMALQAFTEAERYIREQQPQVLTSSASQDHRWRVEHAQVLAADQFARFRDLHVIASMQPNHLLTDMNWALARIGPERAKHAYAWAEFLHNGVYLAFGTDYLVEPIAPFRGVYAAVSRKIEAGTAEFFRWQKLTIDRKSVV